MPPSSDRDDVPRVDSASPARAVGPEPLGTLVLLGGATSPGGAAFGRVLALTNALGGGRIIGLTVASPRPGESARHWRTVFRDVGATNVEIPNFDRGNAALDAEVAAKIRKADGVFLGGGDQVALVSALTGTRTVAAIREVYRAGGVVAGTSAGAAALSALTLAGGEVDYEGNLVAQYIGPGLGLLGFDTIIDTHFSQRRRLQRLFLVVAQHSQLFGIGIDEDTGLVVDGDVGEVVGAGSVTFVDGRDTVRFDNAAELEAGRQLTLSHLRVGVVGTGYHLNLRARELQELLTGEAPDRLRRR